MGFLTKLEKLTEKYLEGFFKSRFTDHLQPAEIAKVLLREMRDQKTVSVSKVYVPNEYMVMVGREDWPLIDSVRVSLAGELQEFLRQKAEEKGYETVGEIKIAFELGADLPLGVVFVNSRFSADLPPTGEPAEPAAPDRAKPAVPDWAKPADLDRAGQDQEDARPAAPAPEVPSPETPAPAGSTPEGAIPEATPAAATPPEAAPTATPPEAAVPEPPALEAPALADSAPAPVAPVPAAKPADYTLVSGRERFYDQAQTSQDTLTRIKAGERLPRAVLIIKAGPKTGAGFPLGLQSALMGRRRANDICLEDTNVSRVHASINYLDGSYYLTDLGSTNGTFVNETRISKKKLASGDLIRMGTTILEFKVV